jgi:hypothetical protein
MLTLHGGFLQLITTYILGKNKLFTCGAKGGR